MQQIVGGRRVYFHAREQRVERRGDDLARPQRRRADEHDLVGERPRIRPAVEHVSRGYVLKRALRTAVPHEQIALAVERDRAIDLASGDEQRGSIHVGDPDR